METAHTETVVEKVTAYVKDVLGIAPSEQTPDVLAKPDDSDLLPPVHLDDTAPELNRPALGPTPEDAGQFEPRTFTMTKRAAEFNAEGISREDAE